MWEKFDIALAASVARRAVTVKNAGYLRYTLCRRLFDQPFEQCYTCSCSANKTHTSHSLMSSNLSTCPSPRCACETSGKEPLPQLKVVHTTTCLCVCRPSPSRCAGETSGKETRPDHSHMPHPHVRMPAKTHKDITTSANLAQKQGGKEGASSASSVSEPAAPNNSVVRWVQG
jgi:hypothetical protein